MMNEDEYCWKLPEKKGIYNGGPMGPEFLPHNNEGKLPSYTSTFDINAMWTHPGREIEITLNHPDAKVPTKNDGDAGWDIYSVEDAVILPGGRCKIDSGISIRLPHNWVGLIWPRSGLAVKNGIDIMAGVIDSGFSNSIMVCLYNTSFESVHLPKGSKIAQYIIQEYKTVTFKIVDKLPESNRGIKGFGSSGV